MSDVLVLSCKVKITKLPSSELVSQFDSEVFVLTETDIFVTSNDYIDQDLFDSELQRLFEFIQSVGIKLRGQILIYQRPKGDNQMTSRVGGRYDISTKEFTFELCDIHVNVKSSKPPAQKLSEEEKQRLFVEFWQSTNRIPRPQEKYKEFNIGSYFHGAKKNKELFDRLSVIMGTN